MTTAPGQRLLSREDEKSRFEKLYQDSLLKRQKELEGQITKEKQLLEQSTKRTPQINKKSQNLKNHSPFHERLYNNAQEQAAKKNELQEKIFRQQGVTFKPQLNKNRSAKSAIGLEKLLDKSQGTLKDATNHDEPRGTPAAQHKRADDLATFSFNGSVKPLDKSLLAKAVVKHQQENNENHQRPATGLRLTLNSPRDQFVAQQQAKKTAAARNAPKKC